MTHPPNSKSCPTSTVSTNPCAWLCLVHVWLALLLYYLRRSSSGSVSAQCKSSAPALASRFTLEKFQVFMWKLWRPTFASEGPACLIGFFSAAMCFSRSAVSFFHYLLWKCHCCYRIIRHFFFSVRRHELSLTHTSIQKKKPTTRSNLLKILGSQPDQIKCLAWNPFSLPPLSSYCFPFIFLGAAYLRQPCRYFQPALQCLFISWQLSFLVIVSYTVKSSRVFW